MIELKDYIVYYTNDRGIKWTASLAADDIYDFVDRIRNILSEREFDSIVKIEKK